MLRGKFIPLLFACVIAPIAIAAADDDVSRAIAVIKSVSREGNGNDSASPAWKTLVAQGPAALIPTLEAIDDSNVITANWLRSAVDAIADTEKQAGRTLPSAKLEAFAKTTTFAPSARRMAYELLVAAEPAAKDRLLSGFVNDPNPDLRRDAISAELDRVAKLPTTEIKPRLRQLFDSARDPDQVGVIVKQLEEQKVKVSVPTHFGFITRWYLIGPFDSAEGKALTLSYPPETAKNHLGKFPGKDRAEVAWIAHETEDKHGNVDLNKAIGKIKNAAAYALAIVNAQKEIPCEIRAGSQNAIQIFLNGKKIFEREEYHHGAAMDRHNTPALLKAGSNVIVVKVCQNNQTDSWAQDWKFQLRVCDSTGGPLPFPLVSQGGVQLGEATIKKEKK